MNYALVALLLVVAAVTIYDVFARPRLLKLEPLAGHVGAVLSTLGHKTDIGTSVGAARGSGTTTPVTGARVLLGYSLSETAGATAEVRLHDGGANTSPLLTGGITFAANGSTGAWFADEGVEVISSTGSISVEVVSGSVRGVLYWG